MFYHFFADLVVFIHLGFVIFAVLGALLILRWHWILWLHLPALFWAVWIEFSGGICPLTPLENWLRIKAGQGGYEGDFVDTYVLPILYPTGLTRDMQVLLGILVIIINLAIYGLIVFNLTRKNRLKRSESPNLSGNRKGLINHESTKRRKHEK